MQMTEKATILVVDDEHGVRQSFNMLLKDAYDVLLAETGEEAVRILKRDTRRYAKRQMTWFRADQEIVWITPEEIKN